MSRFMGRATHTMIPNSLRRAIDWRKLVFEEGEEVWVQCVKSGKWKDKGVVEASGVQTTAPSKVMQC